MKRITSILLSLLLMLSVVGCGTSEAPPTPEPEAPTPPPVDDPHPEEPTVLGGDIVLSGESYWVADTSDELLIDLTLFEDGTARLREIENGLWLVSSVQEENMLWTSVADGTIRLYASVDDADPCCIGYLGADGTMELERAGGTYQFRQEEMPQGGNLYAPAQLQGVWLQTEYEIEGDVGETMPGRLESLVFRPDLVGDRQTLLVTSETRIYDGYLLEEEFSGADITVLDEPLYSGCGNEEWSVRIGEESPLNEDGYPINTETYVTLLDQNTLLQQCYFTFDGGPGVSYQTFKRFLPNASAEISLAQLEGCNFELSGFTTGDGTVQNAPDGVQSFFLHLDTQGEHYFTVTFEDGSYHRGEGNWLKGEGGTVLLYSEGNEDDWFAGAAQAVDEVPEVCLWYKGGIMKLTYTEEYSDWGGYVDTMTDLEGNAFSAPAEALLVYYGDSYLDMSAFRDNQWVQYFALADGPDAREILFTSVTDDTTFWVENDGVKVAELGTMMAGESFVIRVGYPETEGSHLCFAVGEEEYYLELSHRSLSLNMWDYIVVG